jgi:hypothetical protein
MKSVRIISFVYVSLLVGLFLYSFTQIDLSLTFSRIDFLRDLVKHFQYIGYFNRPLSTFFYIFLIVMLFNCYLGFLIMAYTKQISKRAVWRLIFITTIITAFAYNAFSYDIFNYIFDAKIVTFYHQNPYVHKALDFQGDQMLSFMRWTHRVYPYGPVWLGLTIPLSFLGFGLFLPTFFLFKSLMVGGFLGSVVIIGKIFQRMNPKRELFGLVFIGLSPFIIIESLVSAHLDIVMIFFALWSLYVLLEKKYFWAIFLLGISIGIKFATVFLLPLFLAVIVLQIMKKKVAWDTFFLYAVLLMIGATIVASFRTTFQPWYLLEPLIFTVFLSRRYYLFIPSIIISFFALLTYVPYLFTGNWDPPIPQQLSMMYGISYLLSFITVVYYFFVKRKKKSTSFSSVSDSEN